MRTSKLFFLELVLYVLVVTTATIVTGRVVKNLSSPLGILAIMNMWQVGTIIITHVAVSSIRSGSENIATTLINYLYRTYQGDTTKKYNLLIKGLDEMVEIVFMNDKLLEIHDGPSTYTLNDTGVFDIRTKDPKHKVPYYLKSNKAFKNNFLGIVPKG